MPEKADGAFFIPYQHFCKHFDEVVICKYHDNYQLSVKNYKFSKSKGKKIFFEIFQAGKYYVILNQKHRKFYSKNESYEYSLLVCVIGKVMNNENFEYVGGKSADCKDVWVECDIAPGKYCAYMKGHWKLFENNEKSITFSIYGPTSVNFQEAKEKEVSRDFLTKLYISKGKNIQREKFKAYKLYGEPDISRAYELTDEGFGYFYYANNSESTKILINFALKESQGVKLMYPFSNEKEAKLIIDPGEKAIILFRYNTEQYLLKFDEIPVFLNNNALNLQFQIGKA